MSTVKKAKLNQEYKAELPFNKKNQHPMATDQFTKSLVYSYIKSTEPDLKFLIMALHLFGGRKDPKEQV